MKLTDFFKKYLKFHIITFYIRDSKTIIFKNKKIKIIKKIIYKLYVYLENLKISLFKNKKKNSKPI